MNERSIFLAALEVIDPVERAAYVKQACEGDDSLRKGVDALLDAHMRPGSFLHATSALNQTIEADDPGVQPGARIGPYKLLQRIGEGGMGIVLMAEQEEPVRRTVALKVIRRGMDSKAILARFEAERQALAMMDHPNIAKVLDAGTTDKGQPYFVMELVKGVPITRFCAENKLGLREKLQLFVPVCQAIQHAHQKGIIHRDIKPSNVLVALFDDRPVPKVIDFGVAKATSQKLTERTLFTGFGSVVGTLEYMSPEQARLNQLDIDTRSDVYALGVLLYELLTGTTPIDRARLKAAALDEVLRLIREEEPMRPSNRLSAACTEPMADPGARVEPNRLGKALQGELDWIVMKALEKDRARRYETANGLARDVERYLQDEPVEACPPTLGYRLRKAYRKNRAAVGVAAAFVSLLTVASVLSASLAVQARSAERVAALERDRAKASEMEANRQRIAANSERQRAEEEQRSAQAIRDFLQTDLLGQASNLGQAEARRRSGANYSLQTNPTVGELLGRAAAQLEPDRIEDKFPGLPFIQAEALRTVGTTYLAINQLEKGLQMLNRAVANYERSRGLDDPAALEARHFVATALDALGRYEEAQATIDDVVRDRSRVLGPYHADTVTSRILQGTLFFRKGRSAEALKHFQQLSEAAREHLGPDHFCTTWAEADYAIALRYCGRKDEAIRLMEQLLVTIRRGSSAIPLDHPAIEPGILMLVDAYKDAGRRDEANSLLRKTLADVESAVGPRSPATWPFRNEIAHEHLRVKEIDAAIALFEFNLGLDVLPGRKMASLDGLAYCHEAAGRADEALAQYRRSLDLLRQTRGDEHRSWHGGKLRVRIGQNLLKKQEYSEAEPYLLDGYRQLVEYSGRQPPGDASLKANLRQSIIELYNATDRPDELVKWLEHEFQDLAEGLDKLAPSSAQVTPAFLREAATLALAYVDADRKDEAIRLFEKVIHRFESAGWPLDEDSLRHHYGRLNLAVSRAGRHDLAGDASATIATRLRALPNNPRDLLARHVFALGHHRLWGERPAEAEAPLREALAMYRELDSDGWDATKAKFWLGIALLLQRKHAEAETLLLEADREIAERQNLAPDWEKHFPGMVAERLAQLYSAIEKPDEAAKWRAAHVNRGSSAP
jgi:serine/threonine protein kinase